mmetsp:Transcript_3743/g.5664  ORF Transcript_3743/g.5664 Transcript_3743/m.5664 type:complete len:94 (-) Transcript_3743:110-391(-)
MGGGDYGDEDGMYGDEGMYGAEGDFGDYGLEDFGGDMGGIGMYGVDLDENLDHDQMAMNSQKGEEQVLLEAFSQPNLLELVQGNLKSVGQNSL